MFVLENGFQPDTGEVGQGGLGFRRQTDFDLQGGSGGVLEGRQHTPQYLAVVIAGPLGYNYVADSKNVFGISGNAFSRMDSAIRSISPIVIGRLSDLVVDSRAVAATGRRRLLVGAVLLGWGRSWCCCWKT